MAAPKNVTFQSRNITIAGHLYLPAPDAPSRAHAAIIVGNPSSGVKEQASGLYARLLADAGFVTLAFDPAYQGESGGFPRNLEDPYQRVEDFKCAVTYMSTLSEDVALVDPSRIGIVGICASGGFVPFAAQADVRMRAVATISASCFGEVTRSGIKDSAAVTPEVLASLLEQSGKDRITQVMTGEAPQTSMLPESADLLPADLPERGALKEGIDYYKTPRGAHPRSVNKQVAWSLDLRANYDSFAFNHMISPRPLLMIAGGDADTAYMSRMGVEKAKEPKELFIIDGMSHVDLYDDTSVTLPKLVDFMTSALCN